MTDRWMIDFDGVIANLHGAMITTCNEKFDTDYRVDEISTWNWWFDQPKKFSDYIWRDCYPSLEWTLANVKPEDGAIDALCDLLSDGETAEDVVIVTSRKAASTVVAGEWLQQHLPPHIRVKIVSADGYRKSQYCQLHRLNVVVEDGAHNLREMNAYRQALYLVEKPYNVDEILAKVTRVPSLAAAVEHRTEHHSYEEHQASLRGDV